MTEFLIPLICLLTAVGLIVALGYNETKLRKEVKEADEEEAMSEFEHHQERMRLARARAERRQIERERERL